MARTHARLFCSVWNDPVFTSLSTESQRLYFLVLSQPNLSLCGHVAWTPKRWARFSPDTKGEDLEDAVVELENAGLVVLDRETEELWVRSFVKHDANILANNKLRKGMQEALSTVISPVITAAFAQKYGDLETESDDRNANPENSGTPILSPRTNSGFSGSSSGTGSSSSSSSASNVEELIDLEAQERLRGREATVGKVTNPRSWLAKTREQIRTEWTESGELQRRLEETTERSARASCERCNDAGLTELEDGTMTRCPHGLKAVG